METKNKPANEIGGQPSGLMIEALTQQSFDQRTSHELRHQNFLPEVRQQFVQSFDRAEECRRARGFRLRQLWTHTDHTRGRGLVQKNNCGRGAKNVQIARAQLISVRQRLRQVAIQFRFYLSQSCRPTEWLVLCRKGSFRSPFKLRPDQVPVVRAKVLACDFSGCCFFDWYAKMYRHWAGSAWPVWNVRCMRINKFWQIFRRPSGLRL